MITDEQIEKSFKGKNFGPAGETLEGKKKMVAMAKQMIPPVKFCWDCGRKLRGRHHVLAKIDGHVRTLHKSCFDDLVRERPQGISELTRN